MRTTIELPVDLMKKVKAQAVQRGVALKTIIIEALIREIISAPSPSKKMIQAK